MLSKPSKRTVLFAEYSLFRALEMSPVHGILMLETPLQLTENVGHPRGAKGLSEKSDADRLGIPANGSERPFLMKSGGYTMKKVAVIMGSASDLPVVEKAISTLQQYGVPFEVHVMSAHRTPDEAARFAMNAREAGFGAIIACAGKAAHLAGAIAARTTLPVIGLPVAAKQLDGIDALLSTVQMPSGIPVATVAIDGAVNAALLSLQILAVSDPEIAAKLDAARAQGREKVLEAEQAIAKQYNM